MSGHWYAKTTNSGSPHEQGLIIDEETGANIAVSYDPKHAPLIAAAPKLLEALETAVNILEDARLVMDADREENLDEWMPGIMRALAKAKEDPR